MLGSELSEPVGQDPSEQPVAQEPVGHEPVEQPVSQEPVGEHPVGQPLGQEPSEPLGQESSEPVGQQPVGEQPVGQEQSQQPVGEPFVAKPEHRPTVSERLKQVAANSVSAQCGESVVRVQVNQDLLGIGRLIQPERITLGGCAATEEDAEAHVITFESELHGCGSELTMTEDVLIYTFTLVYEPKPLANTSIVKTSAAMVDIECHYLRNHDVSSNALKPTWIPNISNMVAEELLYFSLRLMTADWQFERPSNHYYLGDIINMEASVMPYHHVPLRVFVDRCVATLAPDVHTVPRYSFIEDHGCLVDAKLTGSSSQFLSRSQDDKIQFQLESFRFQPQNDSQQLYITCHLKASAASSPIDAENKACSFTDGWKAAGGDDLVCGCCDSSCAVSKARDLDSDLDMQKEGEATLGPIMTIMVWTGGMICSAEKLPVLNFLS
uniref:Zona pellucida sperm-binding protein 3 n=1 Tax=Oncorhynchus tshawytscha TaxID=74940 RepID=A0AAZ3PKX4_ONCTS